jgi:hypothetical protein
MLQATPGQGIVAILIGLSLVDVPGKRALERAWRPPLVIPGRGEA